MSDSTNLIEAQSKSGVATPAVVKILVSRGSATSNQTPICEAQEILEQIRTGRGLREKVEPIRSTFRGVLASNDNDRKAAKNAIHKQKMNLPGVLWSGTFKVRSDDAIIEHSGLLCADLDGLGEQISAARSKLINSPYLWAMFTSPTGDGLKCVFRVPADKDTHLASFYAVKKHVSELTNVEVDESCKNVGRLCFLSHDPDVYLRSAARELPPSLDVGKPQLAPAAVISDVQFESRRRIAAELLGEIKWTGPNRGFCSCPGEELHTTGDGERDCEVYLESAKIHCFHDSCNEVVKETTGQLRTRLQRVPNNFVLPSLIDASDLIGSDLARPPELVQGVLHQGSKMVIAGGSKSFKTWTLIDLAVSVATGTPWWGFETKQGRVVYMNFEIQDSFFRERLLAVCDAKDCDLAKGQFSYWGLRGKAADLGELMFEVTSILKDGGYSLIVFDPIYKGLGNRDENKAGDIGSLLNELESLAVETGAAVAFGHHQSKGNQSKKDPMDRMGGSGVFARDPDAILTMTKHKTEDAFTIDPILRNFAPLKPFVVRRTHPLMVRDATLDPTQLKQAGRPKSYDIQQVLECLPEEGLTAGQWAARTKDRYGMGKTTHNDLRNLAEADGLVEKRENKFFRVHKVVSFDPLAEVGSGSKEPSAA